MFLYVIVLAYSVALRFLVIPAARVMAFFSDRVERQLEGRTFAASQNLYLTLAKKRRHFKNCIVFFCSSAGEYEQAKPIVDRLAQRGVFTHIFLFSKSGFDFAKVRQEASSYSLSPIDYIWTWGNFFAALQPQHIVIIRHEYWPSFLAMAQTWGKLFVVNGVPPAMLGRENHLKTKLSAATKRLLLGPDVHAFTADSCGTSYFCEELGYPKEQVTLIGDTKYDRVVERIKNLRDESLSRADQIKKCWTDPRPILILGSAHLPDVEFVLKALRENASPKFRLLIVPHDIGSKNLTTIRQQLLDQKLQVEWFTEFEVLALDKRQIKCDAIIVDALGKLSELYGIADVAWVGGALHAKIHNVLEPAVWGLPITCGPLFHNSQEAKLLHSRGLLTASNNPTVVAEAWQNQLRDKNSLEAKLTAEISNLCGASDAFVKALNI